MSLVITIIALCLVVVGARGREVLTGLAREDHSVSSEEIPGIAPKKTVIPKEY